MSRKQTIRSHAGIVLWAPASKVLADYLDGRGIEHNLEGRKLRIFACDAGKDTMNAILADLEGVVRGMREAVTFTGALTANLGMHFLDETYSLSIDLPAKWTGRLSELGVDLIVSIYRTSS